MKTAATLVAWLFLVQMAPQPDGIQRRTFVDGRDGKSYRIVAIGNQTWLAENLQFDIGQGSRCLADREENCAEYGRLYTWLAATRACPASWRLPSENDWWTLERFLGMDASELEGRGYRGVDEGALVREGGTSGFDVRLTGYMRPDGTPRREGERAAFWTATRSTNPDASWHRDISEDPRIYRSPVDHPYYLSVRCVQDLEEM